MQIARIVRLIGLTAMIATCLLLAACEEKVTLENYEQIQVGMTRLEVERVLGGGRDETPSAGTDISAAGLASRGEAPDEVWVWKSADGGKIVITFAEGKVVQKRQEGLQ